MVFSRLNPAHCDTQDIIEKRSPYFSQQAKSQTGTAFPPPPLASTPPVHTTHATIASTNQLQELLSYYPYTDQRTYIQYMARLVPQYAQRVEIAGLEEPRRQSFSEMKGVQSEPPMNRGGGGPSPRHQLGGLESADRGLSQERFDEII
jgi:hypothetical protein